MKDLTTGHEGKLIFNFAVPMLIGNIFQQLYQIIDSIVVGHYLGKEALAAVGASFPIIFSLVSLIIGVASGGTVLIAQFFGAKEMGKVKATIDTLYISLFFASIVVTVLGIVFSYQIFKLMNLPENIMPQALSFLRIYLIGLISFFGYNATSSVLRGLGDSKTPLVFLVFSTVLNVLLDLLFIPVLGLGVGSAALATVLSQTAALVASSIYLNKTHKIIRVSFINLTFNRAIFKKIIKIGLPTGLQQTFVAFGMMALMGIVNGFGTDVIAAYSVVGRIDSLAGMPAMNFSMALSAFVGQNIGAQKSERIKSGYKATMLMSSALAIFVTLIVFFLGDKLMGLFTNDTNVIAIGHQYLRIVGMFYLAFNAMFVLGGVMRGSGDTLIPMIITLFALWLIRIPAAYFLSKSFGIVGVWWAIPVAWLVGTTASYFYYRTGRWKRKSIYGVRKD